VSVTDTLAKSGIHEEWIETLRTEESKLFGFDGLDRVLRQTDLKPGSTILDAGCGTGTNSEWLADRGFRVTGADFSDFALSKAKGDVDYRKEDLTKLSFPDASFDAVVCIGVLMHIPDLEDALSELVRVLKPNGWLILSEANSYSPESYAFRLHWWLSARPVLVERKRCGLEVWSRTKGGPLLSRQISAGWLQGYLAVRGVNLVDRSPGQLTELPAYVRSKWPHRLNRWWIRLRGPASLAANNYFLFRK
jgi:SAM-dependent methyltransferase